MSNGHFFFGAMWLFFVYVPQVGDDFDNVFQLIVCCEYKPKTTSPSFGENPTDIEGLSFSYDV